MRRINIQSVEVDGVSRVIFIQAKGFPSFFTADDCARYYR